MSDGGPTLRDKLVAVALEELSRTPAERLSIRDVARKAGVSHQAPYVHFGGKRMFLAAVAGAGLDAAATEARSAVEAAGQDPGTRLHALASAYRAFTLEQPHVHDLAYGPLVAKADHPDLQRAAAHYWHLVERVVGSCQPPGVERGEVLNRCAEVWGLIFGLGRLGSLRQIPGLVPAPLDVLMHEGIEIMRRGWG